MAKPSRPPEAPAAEPLPVPSYPTLEQFVERAAPTDIDQAFSQIRAGLASLKGPRAQQAKKVDVALVRTEELLSYLLEVRERLDADKKGKKSARK